MYPQQPFVIVQAEMCRKSNRTSKTTCSSPSPQLEVNTRNNVIHPQSRLVSGAPDLHLGGCGDFYAERSHHTKIFCFHALDASKRAPIGEVEFTAIRGPHGTIPVRVFYPRSGEERRKAGDAGALVYFHGGGYTVGTVDEFENGCRLLAERAGVQVYAWRFPTQLDEYACVVEWLQGEGGETRGVSPDRVCGGGDSAGGNMTAALSLRLRDEGKKPLKAQILLYPEARLPFDTPAAAENNTGLYLECNGIFSFADHYLPRGVAPSNPYVSPGMQPISSLESVPPAAVFTCGYDPLRDVGVEYASKLQEAGNAVSWHHFEALTHVFLQLAPWSKQAMRASETVGDELKRLAYMHE
ncbi:hypothetical protein PUNSTDRAFT_116295 [Punctularia strigosozonata HHB-11173 SS5]|uniref:Alpha/beta hydrolase fold-3 domain-containing protein n=1 Tax=Punctularia strigosozonata (strain HHB-11173) TaxID=741275 RepID=R7S310_PUNST|nr:uncharacterized protein PUNSTDRAFT_116295 [Punctularia strigosozonata HHB-11173 SS5]EIN04618.1 hypothetical protein PUNSTDRAFT_116295 [Punctularia strigosozonata HHB-11173 SS5]